MHVSSSDHTRFLSSNGIRRFMQRHALVCYFLMTFSLSWLAWIPFVLSQDGLGLLPFRPGQAALLPGAYMGPLLSAMLMTAALEGKAGVGRLLRRFVQGRVGWYWYPLVLCGIPIIISAGSLVLPGAGQALHTTLFSQFFLLFPLILLLEILTSGLAEEPGWRGFALPRLQQQLGPLSGSCVLGVLWGCWHLPLFLTDWGNGAGWPEITMFILSTVCIAILFSMVFNLTRGSLLIAILMHATIDAFTSTAAGTGLISTQWLVKHESLAILLGFGAVALVLVILTRGRLAYGRTPSPLAAASASTTDQP